MNSLQDHHDLVQLTHAYCWALDTKEWDELRHVFTDDAVTDLGKGGQTGIEQIIARVSDALSAFDVTQHTVSTHQIAIDGDSASGRCYVQAQHVRRGAAGGGDNMMIGARYEDRYVRTSAGWRIAERAIIFMWRD